MLKVTERLMCMGRELGTSPLCLHASDVEAVSGVGDHSRIHLYSGKKIDVKEPLDGVVKMVDRELNQCLYKPNGDLDIDGVVCRFLGTRPVAVEGTPNA